MNCAICYIELSAEIIITISCGCKFCNHCLNLWTTYQLDKYTTREFFIDCPNGIQFHYMTEDDIKSCLNENNYRNYQSILLRRSLLLEPDFRICPSKNCNYIG